MPLYTQKKFPQNSQESVCTPIALQTQHWTQRGLPKTILKSKWVYTQKNNSYEKTSEETVPLVHPLHKSYTVFLRIFTSIDANGIAAGTVNLFLYFFYRC
jgi:hypothetical protein